MATTSDIRNGMVLRYNNDLWQVVQFQHVKPGKGQAFVRTKLKSVTSGKVVEVTFPAGSRIDPVRVERRPYQFLYAEGDLYHLMNLEDFDQIAVQKDLIENAQFLKEGETVTVHFYVEEERPVRVELPVAVVLQVVHAEPGVKGDTATNATKRVKLETGAELQVPLFVEEGDKVKVDTREGKYLERVRDKK